MPYITREYYMNDYKGAAFDDAEAFDRVAKRASEIVNMLANGALHGKEIEELPTFIKAQVKKATAAQIEYLQSGGLDKAIGGGGGHGQVSVGNFSYGDKAGTSGKLSRQSEMTSAAVIAHLTPTGLLYRGVEVIG